MVEIATPKEFFEKVLPVKFDSNKAAGFEAVVQLNIKGPDGGDWHIFFEGKSYRVKEGVHPSPSISVEAADKDYVDLVNGKLDGTRAFFSGKIKIKGSIAVGMKLREIGFL